MYLEDVLSLWDPTSGTSGKKRSIWTPLLYALIAEEGRFRLHSQLVEPDMALE